MGVRHDVDSSVGSRETTRERAGWAWCGVGFVVLFVAYAAMTFDGAGGSREEISSFFAKSGNRERIALAATFLAGSGFLFVWFLSGLRAALVSAEGAPGRMGSLAQASGLAFVTLVLVSAAVDATISGAIDYHPAYAFDASHHSLFSSLGFWLFGYAGTIVSALPAAASLVGRRTGLLPGWLVWAGFVVAGLSVFSMPLFLMPVALLIVWILAVSVLGVTGRVRP